MESAFSTLNKVNVNEHVETKGVNKLSYLSWAWAWKELKARYPESYYTIYESADGCIYHTDGNTCWVKTGVTLVDGDKALEHIEYLPIMDYKNMSIKAENVTSMDANKAIQRSLTKAVARHGLGLYIYAGEDLPEDAPVDTSIPASAQRVSAGAKYTPKPANPNATVTTDAPVMPLEPSPRVLAIQTIGEVHGMTSDEEKKLFRGLITKIFAPNKSAGTFEQFIDRLSDADYNASLTLLESYIKEYKKNGNPKR